MKTILDVLNAVDEKFSTKDRWCQNSYAKDVFGGKTRETDDDACCWCLSGCIISLTEESSRQGMANVLGTKTLDFMNAFIRKESNGIFQAIHYWNDAEVRTFADIKNIIKRAKENLINV